MSANTSPSLYEILEIAPTATSDQITEAITTARRTWRKRAEHPSLSVRQVAEQRLAAIADAERILLDESKRAAYNRELEQGESAADADAAPRIVIPAVGQQTNAKLELLRIVNVGAASPGPFVPELQADKSPVLFPDEKYIQHLTGIGECFYKPWPTAPLQEVSPLWGDTTFYFTDQRLIFICPDFVLPEQSRMLRDAEDFSTVMLGALSQARKNAKAQAASRGRALAGAVPWEYLVELILIPPDQGENSTGLGFAVDAGDATYLVGLTIPGADLHWARQQIEWSLKVALHRRLAVLGDGILPSEKSVISSILDNPRPNFEPNGQLTYLAPVALDGGHALTLL